MSDVLDLNCWVLGDDLSRVFPIKVSQSETVGGLKREIKKEKTPALDGYAADRLRF